MAGEVSRDITERILLPEDIVKAHREGIIHFHDSDYYAQHMHNCDLVNLEDMLQNGTVISGTMIEKPHSFSTACNISTQIIAQVASNQYGGQSISLTHLAPFVNVSREKIRREVKEEFEFAGCKVDEQRMNEIVEKRLRKEINRGVQTLQYQVVTLLYDQRTGSVYNRVHVPRRGKKRAGKARSCHDNRGNAQPEAAGESRTSRAFM